MSDYKVAALMIDALPRSKHLIGDRSYNAARFRHALAERGITACIPSKRRVAIPHDTTIYPQCHKVEIMFGRLQN